MIRKLYNNLEEILGSILLGAICLIATIQVVSRYISQKPYSWTEEVGTGLFVYLTFVGASLALKRNEHFALEIIVDHLPRKIQFVAKLLSAVLVIVFAALVTWYGWQFAYDSRNVTTPALEMSKTVLVAAIPLGGVLMFIRSIEMLVKVWRNRSHPEDIATGKDAAET